MSSRPQSGRVTLLFSVVVLSTLFSLSAHAAIPRGIGNIDEFNDSFCVEKRGAVSLNLRYIHRLSQMVHSDLERWASLWNRLSIDPNESERSATRKVVTHAVETIFKAADLDDTPVGSAIREIDQPLQQSLSMQDSEGHNHELAFNVRPARGLASVEYRGPVTAGLYYYAGDSRLAVEVSRRTGDSSRILVKSEMRAAESIQTVGFQLTW